MATTTTQPLDQFLARLTGGKEVGLIIAKDKKARTALMHSLDRAGYLHVLSPAHLLKRLQVASKNYFLIDGVTGKDAYDVAAQYPTGQIEWFDSKQMRQTVVTPQYESAQAVLIVTKSDLTSLQKKGLPLRSLVGLTYQD